MFARGVLRMLLFLDKIEISRVNLDVIEVPELNATKMFSGKLNSKNKQRLLNIPIARESIRKRNPTLLRNEDDEKCIMVYDAIMEVQMGSNFQNYKSLTKTL